MVLLQYRCTVQKAQGRDSLRQLRIIFIAALSPCYTLICWTASVYAASTTVCPSDTELHDLHDCCISADMDRRDGRREDVDNLGDEGKGEIGGKE